MQRGLTGNCPRWDEDDIKFYHGEARHGGARPGKARQGEARQGKARQGKAGRGKVILILLKGGIS